MNKIVEAVSDVVIPRLKNPFIVAFAISWIAFNWKPILLLLFADGSIEYKIQFVTLFYSKFCNIIGWPLFSCLFYLFIVPLVNRFNEYALKSNTIARENIKTSHEEHKIDVERRIAVAEFNKQEVLRKLKEGERNDVFVKKLEDQIEELKLQIVEQRETNLEQNRKHNEELKGIHEKYNQEVEELTLSRNIELTENSDLLRTIEEIRNELQTTSYLLHETQADKEQLILEKQKIESELSIRVFILQRQQQPNTKIIYLGNRDLLEYFDSNNNIIYFDLNRNQIVDHADVFEMLTKEDASELHQGEQLNNAIQMYHNYLASKFE